MKALLLSDVKKIEYVDFPTPTAGPNEVLVRWKACGICGSDVHGYDGSTGRRIPPLIMGARGGREIAALGQGVTTWQVGDRVTFDSTIYCGRCWYCQHGQVNLCDKPGACWGFRAPNTGSTARLPITWWFRSTFSTPCPGGQFYPGSGGRGAVNRLPCRRPDPLQINESVLVVGSG